MAFLVLSTFSMDAVEETHIMYEKTEVSESEHEMITGGQNIRVIEEN